MKELRVTVADDLYSGGVRIYVAQVDDAENKIWVARVDGGTLLFEPVPEGVEPIPTLRVGRMQAQALMAKMAEALDDAGAHPKRLEGLEGRLEAQGAHLEDLRTLLKLPYRRGRADG